jgi:hypothetical protein
MPKHIVSLFAALALSVMLLATASRVNHSSTVPVWNGSSQLADGIPMPPPKPTKVSPTGRIWIADGIPMPPPKPTKAAPTGKAWIAEGIPMPPPKPTKFAYRS